VCEETHNETNDKNNNSSGKPDQSEIKINWNEFMPYEKFEAQISHLPENKKDKIYQLMNKYHSIFAKNQYDVGTVNEYEVHIKLTENHYIVKKTLQIFAGGPN